MRRPQVLPYAGVALLALLAGCAGTPSSPAPVEYAVAARWVLGGSGGWDALTVDSPRHRLFLTRGTRIEVVDTESGRLVGTIPGTNSVHEVALAPELGRGYASAGRSSSITEFDYDSLAVRREVAVPGVNPDSILYESRTRRLFVFNGGSDNVVVFDAVSLAPLATVALPGKPEFAVHDGHGRVFVNIESETGQIVAMDAGTLAVTAIWTLPGCASPTGLALDRGRHRLFSACGNRTLAVTDARTGRQLARVPIGEHPDGAAYDAVRRRVFSSNGEGTLSIVQQLSADRYAPAATLTTQRGARTMALDGQSGRVYLVTAELAPPPAPTPEEPRPRPVPVPGTFVVLVAAPLR